MEGGQVEVVSFLAEAVGWAWIVVRFSGTGSYCSGFLALSVPKVSLGTHGCVLRKSVRKTCLPKPNTASEVRYTLTQRIKCAQQTDILCAVSHLTDRL